MSLNYQSLDFIFTLYRIVRRKRRRQIFEEIQIMEIAFINEMNKEV